jgi:hypothetical protein
VIETIRPSTPASRSTHLRWSVKKALSSVRRLIDGVRDSQCQKCAGLLLDDLIRPRQQ